MYKHNRIKHSDIKHKCTECNFTHTFPTKVRTHYREVHLGAGRNRRKQEKCGKPNCKDVGKSDCKELLHFVLFCDQCEFSTKRNDNLKLHIKRVHEGLIESFSCSHCDFTTNLESYLRRHTRGMHISIYGASSRKKTYMCDYEGCTYITLKQSGLRTHIETKHEGIVRFRCEFMNCTFSTNERKGLKEHTMRHGEKVYNCNLCEKTFVMKKTMKTHIRNIHEGVGRFKCGYINCTFGTYDKRVLEIHTVKHTGVKLYQCHLCDRTFSSKQNKKQHIKNVHDKLDIKIINTTEEIPKSESN